MNGRVEKRFAFLNSKRNSDCAAIQYGAQSESTGPSLVINDVRIVSFGVLGNEHKGHVWAQSVTS